MKILQDISHEADYIGDVQENRVGIDRENIDFITTLLTSNLYSKPLESFLRETIANAYDSHVEAGSNEYILLVITRTGYNEFTISVRDYGVGLSPERFDQIYKNIGSSTKRDSNDYIGAFGIGRFAGLSCSDVVNINSYYNGTKYSYLMYKNGKGINIDKLQKIQNSTFKNGLEVSISMKVFEHELCKAFKKLALFDKLHVEYIDKYSNSGLYAGYYRLKDYVESFNTRSIANFKTFSICSLDRSDRYIKVGKILYNNDDWGDFHTSNGIIVDVPIGEVDITPNREELQFTERTKNAISKHIEETKKELQEIVSAINKEDFSMKSFYKYATESYIECTVQNIQLSINRDDVKVNSLAYTINNNPVPIGFEEFLGAIHRMGIDKNNIYKIFNPSMFKGAFKLTRAYADMSYILDGSLNLGIKLDRVTRAVTLDWYTSAFKSPTVVINDLQALQKQISSYLENSYCYTAPPSAINLYTKFLFDNITTYNMSNDKVPESYKEEYKKAHKKNKAPVSGETPIRIYYKDSNYSLGYLRNVIHNGLVVYSAHTKNDSAIRHLTNSLACLDNIQFITVKKDSLSMFESNKRFMLLEDFMDFENNTLAKVTTARIILRSFDAVLNNQYAEYKFRNLPIVGEFKKKYFKYASASRNTNDTLDALVTKYENNGWYNKADVEYFKINSDDLKVLDTLRTMEEDKSEIVKSIAFFMFGKNDKLGLKVPKINICKYLKQFKYGCI